MNVQTRRAFAGRLALACAAVLLASGAAYAHDYWFEREGADYFLLGGHRHSEHGGTARIPYDPKLVAELVCLEPSGSRREIASVAAYPARVAGPCVALLARMGHDSVKRFEAWHAALDRPLGDGLEIVSETDPFAVEPGRKLRLRVMDRGEPRGAVSVAYDGKARGVTGLDGRINIRVRHGGPQLITASVDEAQGGDGTHTRATTLLFALPESD